jgi:hypothetical protein
MDTQRAPVFMADMFLNGESKSIATMPMLKICTPPPDMYNMNACMGSDLTGEMAKSHARFCFSASRESTAAVVAEEDLLGALACCASILTCSLEFDEWVYPHL